MSSTSTPNRSPQPGTPRIPLTRTLAIIKTHAVKHRLTIERSIVEAGFEIVKERQMAFDPEGDRETLLELFGRDADSLGEEPVWVYVLERRRAAEVWLTLMGPENPEVARVDQPNSLRAVYGVDVHDNAFAGSPDTATAEEQIAALFASSPPFPTADDDDYGDVDADPMSLSPPPNHQANGRQYDSVRSVQSIGSQRSSTSSRANGQPANGRLLNGTGFKARSVPTTNAAPDISPRMTRAASLRIGLPTDERRPALRTTRTREEQQAVFLDVPGHKRSQTIAVASTAAPTIAPRQTKASALRENKDLLAKQPSWGTARRESITTMDRPKAGVANFDNVPGHKRRDSIPVASTMTPTVAPRANRSAELRAAKMANSNGPPSSFRTGGSVPVRRSSTSALNDKTPGSTSRASSSLGRTALAPAAPRPSVARPPPSSFNGGASTSIAPSSRSNSSIGTAPQTIRRSSSALAAPLKKPDIEPRTNRSAMLREKAKLEAQQKAERGKR